MATEELGTVFFGMLPNARAAEKTVISVVSAVWFPWFRPFRFGGFGRFVSVVSLVSVVSAVSFRWFRWFRRFRFGGFVSLFRVLVHAFHFIRIAQEGHMYRSRSLFTINIAPWLRWCSVSTLDFKLPAERFQTHVR